MSRRPHYVSRNFFEIPPEYGSLTLKDQPSWRIMRVMSKVCFGIGLIMTNAYVGRCIDATLWFESYLPRLRIDHLLGIYAVSWLLSVIGPAEREYRSIEVRRTILSKQLHHRLYYNICVIGCLVVWTCAIRRVCFR